MPRYRLKPKEVEAIQWDGTTDGLDLLTKSGATIKVLGHSRTIWLGVGNRWETLVGGDWVLIAAGGEVARMDDDDFTELYELVPPHVPETWPI